MKKILIATHGTLAQGIYDSLNLIIGELEGVTVVNAYVNQSSLEDELMRFLNNVKENDDIYVLTDLHGGSVNRSIVELFFEQEIKANIISGVNLPLALSIYLSDEDINQESLLNYIDEAQKEIKLVVTEKVGLNDNEDFFE